MSRMKNRLMVLGAALAALCAPAFAETVERNYKPAPARNVISILNGDENNGPAANQIPAQQTPSVVDGRTINITQPDVPDSVQTDSAQPSRQQAQPAPQQPVQQQPVRRAEPAPQPSRSSTQISEADWWKDTGNPKVFAFRDCLSGYARAQAEVRPKVNLKGILAEAIKGECKSPFNEVSGVLAAQFGERRAKKMAQELTGSTFVPALRSAVLDVRKEQKAAQRQQARSQAVAAAPQTQSVPAPQQQPQPANAPVRTPVASANAAAAPEPVGPQLDVAIAKEDMFKCYRARTDSIGAQPGRSIDEVVDQVLLECSDHTRSFFTRLFTVYPVAPAKQGEKMREAIAQNYRPAIAERVKTLRTSGGINGSSGTSTVVKSATSTSQ